MSGRGTKITRRKFSSQVSKNIHLIFFSLSCHVDIKLMNMKILTRATRRIENWTEIILLANFTLSQITFHPTTTCDVSLCVFSFIFFFILKFNIFSILYFFFVFWFFHPIYFFFDAIKICVRESKSGKSTKKRTTWDENIHKSLFYVHSFSLTHISTLNPSEFKKCNVVCISWGQRGDNFSG